MKRQKPTVTIGIPAYNEEATIEGLLRALLAQKKTNFILKKIIVLSDGSTDQTNSRVTKMKNKMIRLIQGTSRKGKAYRLNRLFRQVKTDILVLVDADCLPNRDALYSLVQTFATHPQTGIVAGNSCPCLPQSTVAQALNIGVKIAKAAAGLKKKNVYAFRGSLLAMKKSFYGTTHLPLEVGTDAFLYFHALTHDIPVSYAKKAVVYYTLPQTLGDHIKQSSRFLHSIQLMRQRFGPITIQEYRVPKSITAQVLISQLFSNPVQPFLYVAISSIVFAANHFTPQKPAAAWDVSLSTKAPIILPTKSYQSL